MSSSPDLKMRLLADTFAIHSLPSQMAIPPAVLDSEPWFMAQTEDELSIVCKSDVYVQSEKVETDWACFKVEGPLDFGLEGIIARIADTLAREHIAIFAISTFHTDYILVKNSNVERALKVLKSAGYEL
jgi:hypothetical protein